MSIALFPLHTVAFPGLPLPLVVFEERYHRMMERVLATDRRFVVAAIRAGLEVGGFAETFRVGCVVEVEHTAERSDGSLAVGVRGVERFRIGARPADDPYPRAEGAPVPDVAGDDAEAAAGAARSALRTYAAALSRATGRDVEAPALPDDPVAASYAGSAAVIVELGRRQRLLECATAAERLRAVAAIALSESALVKSVGPPVDRTGVPFSKN